MNMISRPALRWYGGKYLLAPFIIRHLPAHRVYVEPYGGAASVLLRKPRAYAEVYNDLDHEVVGLFRVLQDPVTAARLVRLLELTPFSRAEFKRSYELTEDPVERARRLIIRSFMGFGSNAHASQEKGHRSTGFRADSNKSGSTPAQDWRNYPAALVEIIERFQGVVLEERPALEIIDSHDRDTTLFYVDPPYLPHLRSPANKYDQKWRMYRHELKPEDHVVLLDRLDSVKGMVVLSGYPDPVYDDRLSHWRRVTKATYADGARKRTEVLWINQRAAAALDMAASAGPLFLEAAQ